MVIEKNKTSTEISNDTFKMFKRNKITFMTDVDALTASIMYANGMAEVTAKKIWYEVSSILNSRLNKLIKTNTK